MPETYLLGRSTDILKLTAGDGISLTRSGDTLTVAGGSSLLSSIASGTVIGRSTAGTGPAEALTTLPTAVQDNITSLGTLAEDLTFGNGFAVQLSKTNTLGANTQTGTISVVEDVGSPINRLTIAANSTGAPNIQLRAVNSGAHIGFNIGGTPNSAAVIMNDGSNNGFVGVRGAGYQNNTDTNQLTTLAQISDRFEITSTKGLLSLPATRLLVGTVASGSAGEIYITAGRGLNLRAITGSVDDFVIRNAADTSIIHIPTGTSQVQISGPLRVDNAGPHAIGGAITSSNILTVLGSLATGSASGRMLSVEGALTPNASGGTLYGLQFAGTFNSHTSGATTRVAALAGRIPTITLNGTGTVTDGATLWVEGAPSTAVNNYALKVDAGVSSFGGNIAGAASILSSSATAGIGYSTGAGGTVTQATNKSTGVTLNKITGLITMDAAALAADTAVTFTLTDSAIAATDTIVLQHNSGGTVGAYTLTAQPAAGSATITVRNVTAGSLSEAIVIRFTVLKSVSS